MHNTMQQACLDGAFRGLFPGQPRYKNELGMGKWACSSQYFLVGERMSSCMKGPLDYYVDLELFILTISPVFGIFIRHTRHRIGFARTDGSRTVEVSE